MARKQGIGDRVRAARVELGWSQRGLSEYSGVSQTGICLIETGRRSPTDATLGPIAAALGRRLEWVRYGTGAES